MEKVEHHLRRRQISTDLSWEQKNPTTYLFRPSKAIIRLERMGSKELWAHRQIRHSGRREQLSFSQSIAKKKAGKVRRKKSIRK